MKPKLVTILGPTAVGKSAVALWIAARVQGEIISGDSLQVYRRMDIGTGKPTPEQRRRVPHHLVDLVDPDEEFNVAMFREAALRAVDEIRSRGNNVVLCGGTGLYIKALSHGLFVGPGRNEEVRRELEKEHRENGPAALHGRLEKTDPEAALRIHPNDRRRIIRALEVFAATGRGMSQWQKDHGFKETAFEELKIGLGREREDLYGLINRRCDAMMTGGLIEEVKGLLASGYGLDLKPLQSVGYRHVGLYLQNQKSLEEALSLMKRDTRRLAKRQLTWFRADREIRWFHPEKERNEMLRSVKDFLG